MILIVLLLAADALLFGFALLFTIGTLQEREYLAPKFGAASAFLALLLVALIVWVPGMRIPVAILFVFLGGFIAACIIPGKPNPKVLKGTMGYIVGETKRFDERDIVFARCRMSPEQTEQYRQYYDMHPELEEPDAKRREKGFLGHPTGRIDKGYPPNVSMMKASFDIPDMLGKYAVAEPHPKSLPFQIDAADATKIVKNFAKHIGADLVGICKVNPNWLYSHRGEIHYGEWEEWGKEITNDLAYAVVLAVEMDWEHVSAAPHTPTVAESAGKYAQGAYISTVLAHWFAHMGYLAVAQNSRHYDMPLVPLAIDAGLGELGRYGYLVAPQYGSRVRLFGVFTNMALIPDQPISIGADEYCQRCKKCAESCPSGAVPQEDKIVFNGVEKWKINPEACFEYWAKAGTDCAICMSICPLGRRGTFINNLYRWMVARSPVAQVLFPYLDNWIYGRKWKPRKVPSWLDYPTSKTAQKENY